MKNNINLNKKQGSYSYALTTNLSKIYKLYENYDVSLADFRTAILKITEQATDTPAKRNFINVLNFKRSKDEIVMYISNITLRAEHMSADINDRWATEK